MSKMVNSRNHRLVQFNPYIEPLSGATTPGQSGPGSDDNEGVLHIPQSSSITETAPSRHSFGGGLSVEKQSVFSPAPHSS